MSTPGYEPARRDEKAKGPLKLILIIGGAACCSGVVVVGILAAIAIPNFLKFECLSKQSEAKTNLSGLFTAEKAFFGEYGTYSSDLLIVNWQPDGLPVYLYGFAHPGPGISPEKARERSAPASAFPRPTSSRRSLPQGEDQCRRG